MATMTEPPEQFLKRLRENKIARVPGTAVFLTRITEGTPPLMIEALLSGWGRYALASACGWREPRVRRASRVAYHPAHRS
jgi:K+ transporter